MHTWVESVVEYLLFFFFFQAEDGIRDYKVTGVQTCALPISAEAAHERARRAAARRRGDLRRRLGPRRLLPGPGVRRRGRSVTERAHLRRRAQIGRASCRERV